MMDEAPPWLLPQRRRRGRIARKRGSGDALARIRAVIALVPRANVITYGHVAEAAGFPRGARLTVRALQHADDLPWHRVVAAGGRIALPGDEGREQRLRLELEGVTFRRERVCMELHAWRPAAAKKRRLR